MTETENKKKTPAIERLLFLSLGIMLLSSSKVIWLLTTASQMSATVIPMVPNKRGFRRPTRSSMKTMKIRSGINLRFGIYTGDLG